jgi:hypothetical protein
MCTNARSEWVVDFWTVLTMAKMFVWRALFDRDVYDPDTVSMMSRVLRAATNELLYVHQSAKDKHRVVMAARVMEAASSGERDFEVLKRAALARSPADRSSRQSAGAQPETIVDLPYKPEVRVPAISAAS